MSRKKVDSKLNRYELLDARKDYGSYDWCVIDKVLHRDNPFRWRDSVVFTGSNKECKDWIKMYG